MLKVINPCSMKVGERFYRPVFCEINIEEGKLSITGVVGPHRGGNCYGGCGQIDMEFKHRHEKDDDKRTYHLVAPEELRFNAGWNREKWYDFLDIWKKWHLNDMQAGCEHQRVNWETDKELTLTDYTGTTRFHEARSKAEDGEMTPAEYAEFAQVALKVGAVTTSSRRPKYETSEMKELLEAGWIKAGKSETKAANWVYPYQHPEGVLTKPCEVCGYKFGTKWLKEELPTDVVEFLEALPETRVTPAWV